MRKMYSKKQLEEIALRKIESVPLLTLEDSLEVGGNLDVGGKITGNEIVENMSGYSATLGSETGYTLEKVYIGACKNGNKLTLVVAVYITKTADAVSDTLDFAFITIPSDVGAKLYPAQVGDYDYQSFLDLRNMDIYYHFNQSPANVEGYVYKLSNTSIQFTLNKTTTMSVGEKYYVRYEATFLLSDDIVGE